MVSLHRAVKGSLILRHPRRDVQRLSEPAHCLERMAKDHCVRQTAGLLVDLTFNELFHLFAAESWHRAQAYPHVESLLADWVSAHQICNRLDDADTVTAGVEIVAH